MIGVVEGKAARLHVLLPVAVLHDDVDRPEAVDGRGDDLERALVDEGDLRRRLLRERDDGVGVQVRPVDRELRAALRRPGVGRDGEDDRRRAVVREEARPEVGAAVGVS